MRILSVHLVPPGDGDHGGGISFSRYVSVMCVGRTGMTEKPVSLFDPLVIWLSLRFPFPLEISIVIPSSLPFVCLC